VIFWIHGHFTVSDAMYLNDMLKYESVNLEDPQDWNLHQFGDLVRMHSYDKGGLSRKIFSKPWWKQWHESIIMKHDNQRSSMAVIAATMHSVIDIEESWRQIHTLDQLISMPPSTTASH
jgi:hypothetical protein